ncbi:hypothetical protein L227DRAFT_421287 [Lentinus tigrinus ALCF2SS1-6]|uniref:Uncharacterized protein n=1 Tax=Lentinus tigrinus ALCF2SS1-6 TaxID=1328759 RepID=A0A5C2RN53_9APHY|nr:hypothetical protein L227DRAFT_421287 [Lentinus tigrinus ALCF2SS1-6]
MTATPRATEAHEAPRHPLSSSAGEGGCWYASLLSFSAFLPSCPSLSLSPLHCPHTQDVPRPTKGEHHHAVESDVIPAPPPLHPSRTRSPAALPSLLPQKCDEEREGDSCKTCLRLRIMCLGWGPKRPARPSAARLDSSATHGAIPEAPADCQDHGRKSQDTAAVRACERRRRRGGQRQPVDSHVDFWTRTPSPPNDPNPGLLEREPEPAPRRTSPGLKVGQGKDMAGVCARRRGGRRG